MKLHSVVDVITNSSSSVYVWPVKDAIQKTKDFLANILLAVGSDVNVDDYFEVTYKLSGDYFDDIDDNEDIKAVLKRYLDHINMSENDWKVLSYEEQDLHLAKIGEMIVDMYIDGEYPDLDRESYNYITKAQYLSVIIKPKNNDGFDLWRFIKNIYDYEAIYN